MPAKNVTVSAIFEVANFSENVELNVTGDAKIGSDLTAAATEKDGEEAVEDVTYKWYTSESPDGAEGSPIDGATDETYTVKAEDLGKYIYAEATYTGTTYTKDKVITSEVLGPVTDPNVFLDENFESYDVATFWTNIKDETSSHDLGNLTIEKNHVGDKSDGTQAAIATESSNKYLHFVASAFATSERGNRIKFDKLGLPNVTTLDDGKALVFTFKSRITTEGWAVTITGVEPKIKAGENGFVSGEWADVTVVIGKDKKGYMAVKSGGKTVSSDFTLSGDTLTSITLYEGNSNNKWTLDLDDMKIAIADKPYTGEATITVKGSDTEAGLDQATVEICGQSLTTGSDGTAKITLPEGTYDYTASMTGYVTSEPQTLTVAEAGQNKSEVTLQKETRAAATQLKLVYTTGTDADGTINADETIELEGKYKDDTYTVPSKYKSAKVITSSGNLHNVYVYESGLESDVTLQEGVTTQYVKVKKLDGEYYTYDDFEKYDAGTVVKDNVSTFATDDTRSTIVHANDTQGNVLQIFSDWNKYVAWNAPENISDKLEISYYMHFGYYNKGKEISATLIDGADNEVAKFTYNTNDCRMTSMKIGDTDISEGLSDSDIQTNNNYFDNGKKTKVVFTVDPTADSIKIAFYNQTGDTLIKEFTGSFPEASAESKNIKQLKFVSNVDSGGKDRGCTINDFAAKKITE